MKLSTSLLFLSLVVGSALTAAAPAPAPAPAEYGVGAAGFAKVVKARRPLNILLTNDDSWASANIRATYYALKSVRALQWWPLSPPPRDSYSYTTLTLR